MQELIDYAISDQMQTGCSASDEVTQFIEEQRSRSSMQGASGSSVQVRSN